MGDAPAAGRKGYHHGRLREAMVEAAVALIEEVGPYAVTVREVARRAGVSPGAPFRHFPTRTALMTAVAEEAMRRFQAEVAAALASVAQADVRTRLQTIGRTYLAWAVENPTHFKVVSNRDLIDYAGSSTLMGINTQTQGLLEDLFRQAASEGRLRGEDANGHALASRAMVYGLARMVADGHLPHPGVEGDALARLDEVLQIFIAGVFRDDVAPTRAGDAQPGPGDPGQAREPEAIAP